MGSSPSKPPSPKKRAPKSALRTAPSRKLAPTTSRTKAKRSGIKAAAGQSQVGGRDQISLEKSTAARSALSVASESTMATAIATDTVKVKTITSAKAMTRDSSTFAQPFADYTTNGSSTAADKQQSAIASDTCIKPIKYTATFYDSLSLSLSLDEEVPDWFSDSDSDSDEEVEEKQHSDEYSIQSPKTIMGFLPAVTSDEALAETAATGDEALCETATTVASVLKTWKCGAVSKTFKAVVAIDFGATRSGMLIALKKKGSEEPTIFTPDWRGGVHLADSFDKAKTDCSLLLNKDGGFVAFGKRARELAHKKYYAKTHSRTRADYLLFFEHFAMELRSSADPSTAKVRAANGRKFNAAIVFTRALKHLRGVAMGILKPKKAAAIERMAETSFFKMDFGLPIDAADVRWVLTVPAIWSETAKDFMRKCALDAGLGTDSANPVLLYEAEATGIALHFHLQTSGQPQIAAGDVYLVLDCGG